MNIEQDANKLREYKIANTIKHSINNNLSVIYKIGRSEDLFVLKQYQKLENYVQEKNILLIKQVYGNYLVNYGINCRWAQKNINFTMTKYSNIGSLYELGEIIKIFPLTCVKFYMKQLLTNLKFIYENSKIPFKTLNHSDVLFQQSYNLIPIGWSKLESIKESQLLYDCGEIMFYMITNTVPRITKGKRFLTNKFWKTLQKSKSFNYFPKEKQMRQEWISFLQKIIEEPTGQQKQRQRTLDKILSDNFFSDTISQQNCLAKIKQIYCLKKVQLQEKQKQQFERTMRSNFIKNLGNSKNFIQPIVYSPPTCQLIRTNQLIEQKSQQSFKRQVQCMKTIQSQSYSPENHLKIHRLKSPICQKEKIIQQKATRSTTESKSLPPSSSSPPIYLDRSSVQYQRTVQSQYPPSYEMIKFIEKFIMSKLHDTQFFSEMSFILKSAKLTSPIIAQPHKYSMKVYFTIIQPDLETGDPIEELLTLLFDFHLQKEDICGNFACEQIHDVLEMKMSNFFLSGIEIEFQKRFYP